MARSWPSRSARATAFVAARSVTVMTSVMVSAIARSMVSKDRERPGTWGAGVDLGLKGRRALVAAASKGLGRACAESLAGEGARVAICARDADEVRMAAEEIGASTGAEVAGIAV